MGKFERVVEEDIIFHKDLRGVEFVTADVGGVLAAPVYGMFQVQDLLAAQDYTSPDGVKLHEGGSVEDGFHWFSPPEDDTKTSIEWTGEWTVTYETFRDMGAAFMVALVLIYILVVWEFGNFRIPALIMAPIPLTLLGIIPMHAIMGAEFTATSMIGWIALAGIIVRNSILLVDFAVHEIQRGIPVTEAVIRSCKTRTRPIVITAFALVCGSGVIITDPIFQGMAISLASGVLVSTILTLVVIPLGCIKASRSLCEVAEVGYDTGSAPLPEVDEPMPQTPSVPKTPILLNLWGKLVTVLLMTFYAVRGIFLLLSQMVGQLFNRRQAAPPQTVPVQNPVPAPVPTPAAAVDPVPKKEVVETPVSTVVPPAASAGNVAGVGKVETESTAAQETPVSDEEPIVPTVEAVPPKKAASPVKKKAAPKRAPVKKAVAKKTAVKKSAVKKATVKKSIVKKAAAKTRPVKKAVVKKVINKPANTKTATKIAVTKAPTKPAPKEGRRRGIRLKLDNDSGIE